MAVRLARIEAVGTRSDVVDEAEVFAPAAMVIWDVVLSQDHPELIDQTAKLRN